MRQRLALVLAFGLGALAGAALAPLVAPARAGVDAVPGPRAARILAASDRVTLTAPSGKARITELARGNQAFLGILELDGGAAVPEHQDPTEETIHVLAGRGSITIDGVTTEVGVGDTIFMPAFARVSYDNGPNTMRAIQVFAGPGPADKYATWTAR